MKGSWELFLKTDSVKVQVGVVDSWTVLEFRILSLPSEYTYEACRIPCLEDR